MSVQIAVRLDDNELAVLDAEVGDGHAASRSDAVRRSISYLDRHRGYRRDAEVLSRLKAADESIYPDLVDMPMSDLTGLDK
jgi:Arc/MetJ-type ribon-helix-helix transcriptional regulator